MPRQVLTPDTVHKPTTVYSHAIIVGNLMYLAGQAPHYHNGAVLPASEPLKQIHAAFGNMAEVLKAGGIDFSNVIRMAVLARERFMIPLFWQVAPEYLGSNCPVMTFAVVKGLAGPEYMIEFDAMAVMD